MRPLHCLLRLWKEGLASEETNASHCHSQSIIHVFAGSVQCVNHRILMVEAAYLFGRQNAQEQREHLYLSAVSRQLRLCRLLCAGCLLTSIITQIPPT